MAIGGPGITNMVTALAAVVGLAGVVELVVLCGFHEMIAGVISAFEVPLPEGEAEPF